MINSAVPRLDDLLTTPQSKKRESLSSNSISLRCRLKEKDKLTVYPAFILLLS